MKKSLLLLAVLCVFTCIHCYSQSPATYKGKRIYLTKAADNTIGVNGFAGFKYNAGDTIVLTAAQNPYSWASFTGLDSVTIINEGGQVVLNWFDNGAIPGGFLFQSCKHIHLTGTGEPGVNYGFLITTPANRGVGVSVYDRSAWFEIDHCKMYNKASALWIKEEVECADSLSFPNWVLHDFRIHDNYIHNCSLEAMYLGSTDPNNYSGTDSSQHPVVYCNGKTCSHKPMRLGNFKIYNNIIDSTGRGAIQLSDADSGRNEIYNNTITNIGYEFNGYQGNGIILGGYTRANVHDNTIDYTYSTGIFSLGSGMVRIIRNTVNHSGTLAGRTESGVPSIMIDTRNTTIPSPGQANPVTLTFKVKGNKLGANTDYNVRVYNTYFTFETDNAICNNTSIAGDRPATHYVATGIYWKNECDTGELNTKNYIPSHATAEKLNSLSNAAIFPNPVTNVVNVNLTDKISG
ncbi:MAG TPA: right-handed parallel beta-helix repeat-containing protein, partial [Parafilimonas sp.]